MNNITTYACGFQINATVSDYMKSIEVEFSTDGGQTYLLPEQDAGAITSGDSLLFRVRETDVFGRVSDWSASNGTNVTLAAPLADLEYVAGYTTEQNVAGTTQYTLHAVLRQDLSPEALGYDAASAVTYYLEAKEQNSTAWSRGTGVAANQSELLLHPLAIGGFFDDGEISDYESGTIGIAENGKFEAITVSAGGMPEGSYDIRLVAQNSFGESVSGNLTLLADDPLLNQEGLIERRVNFLGDAPETSVVTRS